ncbi:MAG TPA: NUDIX domain-containing protein [Candidatus Binatia bacterium]|nr:NUDIX domain-containing protein [Candidatus Binatia bacterium]
MAAEPVPAATVVLLRDSGGGPEVLMVRRHEQSGDFAGASVFPGGIVDPGDEDLELAPAESGFSIHAALACLGEALPAAEARALYVAACRELFEEAGILLSTTVADLALARLCARRPGLQARTESLREALAAERCVLALDRLLPFARWITPDFQARRWDTRFFAAEAPQGQTAECDGSETSEAVWLRPAEALEAYRAGEHLLAPPTFRVLEELSRFRSPAEALESLRAAGPPRPILPVRLHGVPALTMVYPGDRDYPAGGRGTGINRLVLDGGRWKSERS